jgi:hypothetical protein
MQPAAATAEAATETVSLHCAHVVLANPSHASANINQGNREKG